MGIKIFTTGGTIDKTYFDAKSEYEVGDPQIMDILRIANVAVEYEVETLLRKDSLDMTDADRRYICERVRDEPANRILITHGTDTMIDTGAALKEVEGKTIVLVGSLSPAQFRDSDAAFNIGFAFAAVQTLGAGVYITMNGRVLRPERARKNRDRNQFEEVGAAGR